jgi:hypothetical protein
MRKYLRFINGLRKFAKTRMSPDEALALALELLRKRIVSRDENFLTLVEKGIYNYSGSPYRNLLASQHIGIQELRTWVSRDGLEATLERLASEGVYFTVDEFKGRDKVVRKGVSFSCKEAMFDNPFLSHAYEVRSGGTRSAGTRIRIDFEYLHQRSLYDALLLHVHGCLHAPVANWFPVFPGAPGINSSLRFSHIGNTVQRWFSQVSEDRLKVGWEKRFGTRTIFFISRMYGSPLAEPEYVELSEPLKVAQWVASMLQEHERCVVYTFAGSAVRVCIAAMEAGLNIKGARFFVTGEPLTPQKRVEIEAAGAFAVPVYGISEAGVIAAGCDQRHEVSDHCHLYKDSMAIIPRRHLIPQFDRALDSFLFTTLLYESPKLLLNVGMGDYGYVTTQQCDCGFGKLGFDKTIGNIRSYEKLTGEGVTFVETDFIRIIEKDLPETFGGASSDYQLVEDEDEHGLTRLRLLVSRKVGEIAEAQVLRKFLDGMRGAEDWAWAQPGTEMWRQSGTVTIERNAPIATAGGKVYPFYLVKKDKSSLKQTSGGDNNGIPCSETQTTSAK